MRSKGEGKGKAIEGAVKVEAGELINDLDLETRSEAECLNGQIQDRPGKARWKAGKKTKKAGRIITGRR